MTWSIFSLHNLLILLKFPDFHCCSSGFIVLHWGALLFFAFPGFHCFYRVFFVFFEFNCCSLVIIGFTFFAPAAPWGKRWQQPASLPLPSSVFFEQLVDDSAALADYSGNGTATSQPA